MFPDEYGILIIIKSFSFMALGKNQYMKVKFRKVLVLQNQLKSGTLFQHVGQGIKMLCSPT